MGNQCGVGYNRVLAQTLGFYIPRSNWEKRGAFNHFRANVATSLNMGPERGMLGQRAYDLAEFTPLQMCFLAISVRGMANKFSCRVMGFGFSEMRKYTKKNCSEKIEYWVSKTQWFSA